LKVETALLAQARIIRGMRIPYPKRMVALLALEKKLEE
jgi:hypothetical protein